MGEGYHTAHAEGAEAILQIVGLAFIAAVPARLHQRYGRQVRPRRPYSYRTCATVAGAGGSALKTW